MVRNAKSPHETDGLVEIPEANCGPWRHELVKELERASGDDPVICDPINDEKNPDPIYVTPRVAAMMGEVRILNEVLGWNSTWRPPWTAQDVLHHKVRPSEATVRGILFAGELIASEMNDFKYSDLETIVRELFRMALSGVHVTLDHAKEVVAAHKNTL